MTKLDWGLVYWGICWLSVGFLVAELAAWAGIAPWPTLTATTRGAVKAWPPLGVILMGVVIFLPTHLLFGRPVWTSLGFGLAVSVLAHLVNHQWP